jgi:Spy/CpxP family protein refolding chaperone
MVRHVHILILSTVLVLVAAGGAILFAQGPGPRGPRGGGPGMGGGLPLRALELTEAQRAQVQQLVQQHREATRALVERAQAARAAERQAMEAIPFNESQIRAATSATAEIEADLAVQQARLQSEIHGLLTAEQQQRLQKIRADREARMKERLARPRQRGPRQARPQV